MKNDFPISQLRVVTCYFKGGHKNDHHMHESQVDTFVKAQVRLHHSPGVNPHNCKKTAELDQISVSTLDLQARSYWWTTEDLQNNSDPKGAEINNVSLGTRVWSRRDVEASNEVFAD